MVELMGWQSHRVQSPMRSVEIVFTLVQHLSGRTLADRMDTLWGGYAELTNDYHFFKWATLAIRPNF
jgi:hypothetical protein